MGINLANDVPDKGLKHRIYRVQETQQHKATLLNVKGHKQF